MAYEMRNNSGSAFPVKEKKDSKHADLTGSCIIEGKDYWINVWEKTASNGGEYLSFSFNLKQATAKREESGFKKTPSNSFDDDISF
jgi:hypothetical protein